LGFTGASARRRFGDFSGLTAGAAASPATLQDFLDLLVAGRAAAAGLGVVGDLLQVLRLLARTTDLDQGGVDGEAFADQVAFLVIVAPLFAAVIGDGGLQRFAAHHRAVHLLRRQAVEVVGDVLVADA
jgi:hypothetical protein